MCVLASVWLGESWSQSLSTCRSQPIVESNSLLFSQAALDTFPFPQYMALFIYSPDSAWSGERTHEEEEEGGRWVAAG